MSDRKTVTIRFSNEDAAEHFAIWLCESGEQQYWDWMECVERDEDGDITGVHLDYHTANGGAFGTTIVAECGRLRRAEGGR